MYTLTNLYLSIVAFEVANVLKSVRGEELNESGVSSSKQVTTIAEGTLERRGTKVIYLWERREREIEGECTSLHPLMTNSLNGLISSMSRFMSLSFSLKPTRMKSPLGWMATL